jgi:site-specific DNA-methyltransferase (adenine-specific)
MPKPKPKLNKEGMEKEFLKDFINKIICGDCIEVMKRFPDNCIDLVITSPPYDNLRDYQEYNFNFEGIAKELFRIIKNGGVVVWVVEDATIKGSETGTSFKQALYFKEIGFNLWDTMIYGKYWTLPSINRNRYRQQFEYMFVFSKGKPRTFNPILEKCKQKGRIPYSKFRYPNGKTKIQNTLQPIKETKIKGNIWFYKIGYMMSSKDKITFEHPATFPEKLAEDHIKSWSNEGDLILDPMCGSGTTCKMAKLNKRNFIGIEISPEYCKITEERLRQELLL